MKIGKNIRLLVRTHDYENITVEASCEADHHDLGWSDEDWAELPPQQRATLTDQLELLVISEVDRMAREELQTVTQYSDSPNLAEDYLSTPPAIDPRSQHARSNQKKTDFQASSGRRIKRGGNTNPSPPAA